MIAYDVASGEQAGQRIHATFSRMAPAILELHIGGSVIRCTSEHPFWVPGTGWCKAGALVPGVGLLNPNGLLLSLDTVERLDDPLTVYNIEVEGLHTYCVSPLGVVVHNKGMAGRLGGRIPEWRGRVNAWRKRLTNRRGSEVGQAAYPRQTSWRPRSNELKSKL